MITDRQRIDWLQKHGKDGWSLIGNEEGLWAVTIGGMSITKKKEILSMTFALHKQAIDGPWKKTFTVESSEWKPSVRKAIDRAIKR